MPAQMIDKAKNAVEAHTKADVEPVNEVVAEEKPSAPAAPPASPPAAAKTDSTEPPAPAAPPPAAAAPVPAAPQTVHIDLNPAEEASPEFKAFISDLRVSGVFQGAHPRVLIGGRTYEVGETVNEDLGIVFAGINADRELALFKDRNGVTLVKKY